MTFARRTLRWCLAALSLGSALACAGSQPAARQPVPAPSAHVPGVPAPDPNARVDTPWPVKTRYVVDLWLHGFALITNDTSKVPLFRRGYRDEMVVEKNKRQIATLLDSDHDSLVRYIDAHPYIAGAQFIALSERNWDVMHRDIQVFLLSGGNPKKAKAPDDAAMIQAYFQLFPGANDRKWLAMFSAALQDEHAKFYQAYWNHIELTRRPVLAAVDSIWSKVYLKQFRRFQEGADLERGDVYLSLPLGAEGRTILGGKRQNVIAVIYPDSIEHAAEAVFVIAHEGVGTIAARAVGDNTTPNEKKSGAADRYLNAATVRGGALVIERVAPAQYTAYQAFYLRAAGIAYAPGGEALAFRQAWPLPDVIVDAMRQALDAATTGI